MCNVKMRKDLIKGTNYTTKRIIIQTKSHQDDDQMLLIIIILMFGQKMTALNELTFNIVKFEPKSYHYYLNQADPWFLEKRPLNL